MNDSWNVTADAENVNDGIDYDSGTGTYRASFDGRDESAALTVISTVATVADVDHLEMEPLYSVVDPDALDTLMASGPSDPSGGDTRVTFTLEGHDVTVHSYGIVAVESDEAMDA